MLLRHINMVIQIRTALVDALGLGTIQIRPCMGMQMVKVSIRLTGTSSLTTL